MVYQKSGDLVTGPNPNPDVADLTYASAADNGTTISFTALTKDLVDPSTDPNWLNNTYIGWAISPTSSGKPIYYRVLPTQSQRHVQR